MVLACNHPLHTRNQAASSSGTPCASPPPSQAPPCVLPITFTFTPAFLQPRSHGWLARCGAITAFQGVFWSVGGSIVRHERPRGQRTVPTARGRRQGNVKRSFTASTASRTPRPSNRRAAAKFSASGVESWQKSRPTGRHRVESGAAEQRCYKGAFAPGLGRLGRAHDERSIGFVCVIILAAGRNG